MVTFQYMLRCSVQSRCFACYFVVVVARVYRQKSKAEVVRVIGWYSSTTLCYTKNFMNEMTSSHFLRKYYNGKSFKNTNNKTSREKKRKIKTNENCKYSTQHIAKTKLVNIAYSCCMKNCCLLLLFPVYIKYKREQITFIDEKKNNSNECPCRP